MGYVKAWKTGIVQCGASRCFLVCWPAAAASIDQVTAQEMAAGKCLTEMMQDGGVTQQHSERFFLLKFFAKARSACQAYNFNRLSLL